MYMANKSVRMVSQKVHHIVDKDPINEGCYAIILEIVDVIYEAKKPLRYPLMIGIGDKLKAQRIARKMSTTYVDCINVLRDTTDLVVCATCDELFLPNSMTFLNGKSYCPICSKDAILKANLKKIKENLLNQGVDPAEVERRLALVSGSIPSGVL
jgi:hypothetical protein